MVVYDTCYLCGERLKVNDPETSYVVPKTFTYKGKKFKGKRINFHRNYYDNLPKYAGLAQ